MLAVVKTHHTKMGFIVQGQIPENLIKYLRKTYGKKLTVTDTQDDYVNIQDTQWFHEQKLQRTPGQVLKIYRQRDEMTQASLGEIMGGVSPQKISDFENNRRGISKTLAKKFAKIFGVSVEKFL